MRSRRLRVVLIAVSLLPACTSSSSSGSSPTPVDTRLIQLTGNLAFGNVTVGTLAPASALIQNLGTAPLHVTGVTAPAGFFVDWTSGTIPPSATQVVSVLFSPYADQTYFGNLVVSADQTSGAAGLPISGSGFVPADAQLLRSTILSTDPLCPGTPPFGTPTAPNCRVFDEVVLGSGRFDATLSWPNATDAQLDLELYDADAGRVVTTSTLTVDRAPATGAHQSLSALVGSGHFQLFVRALSIAQPPTYVIVAHPPVGLQNRAPAAGVLRLQPGSRLR